MNFKILGISVVAGIATVLAVYSAMIAGTAGVPLMLVAAFPVYVTSLAYGTHAGMAASVMAIVVSATLISPQAAIMIGLSITIPASIIGHQANLAQQAPDGTMEWYPVGRLLFNLTLILSLALVLMGYMMDFNSYAQLPELSAVVQLFLEQNPPPTPLTNDEIVNLTQAVFRMLPFVFASMWLVIHIINLQLGALVCRSSGLLPRPKDDVPAAADMPKYAVVVLGFSLLALAVIDGGLQPVAAVFAGCFLTALALIGLAALHKQARGNAAGFLLLILTYVLVLLFFVPLYLLAIGGLIRTFSNFKNPPPSAGQNHS